MPNVDTLGLKKIYVAPVDWDNESIPANNTSTAAATDWVDLGDVYMDTATLSEDDPETTVHKSETSKRRIVTSKPGDCNLELSLMSPDIDLLVRYFGGTKTTTGSGASAKTSWSRPVKRQPKPFAIHILAEDGYTIKSALVSITPKLEMTYQENGIFLVPLAIKILGEVVVTDDTADPLYHAA